MDNMDSQLIAQALNYHGQQLQKVWESERNEAELAMFNLKEPSFEIYQQRQKTLSFGDRGKRLKLQQFIVKKADSLYDKTNLAKTSDPLKQELGDEDFYATMPGLDSFVVMEKSQRIRNFLESLIVGDVIFAQVMGKSAAGLLLKVLCNCSDFPRVVPDLGVKALILNTATVPAVDKKGVTRGYMANDLVCVVVGEVNVEAERVVAVMNVPPREGQSPHPPMGLIHTEDLPDAYKKAMDNKGQSYETIMENSAGFNNPNNIKYLSDLMGLGSTNYSNMIGLRERFPANEYATELRQAQASKWAFRSVAEGIDHFKAGRHTEAFQCLNKALTVDPRNVEGLVARGALYANSGSFKKAIDDFESALKLNPTHANARKYMAETLVALGRSYEDEKKYDDAVKSYENCLAIAPYHEEARNSIEYIKSKTLPPTLTNNLEPFKQTFEPETENNDSKKNKKKRKKERKSRPKKHNQHWSSSSSSSSGGSSSSSSDSDSSASSGSSSGSSRSTSRSSNRKRKQKKDQHGSLSPLSKRMAQYNNPPSASLSTGLNSHDILQPGLYSSHSREKEDYESKVRKFLEQTKDDSDYEEKVRKFLEETARWKREKEKEKKQQQQHQHQHLDMDKSKKKKKKDKKAKDKDKEEKKLRKKKKKEDRKKRKSKDKLEQDLQTSLPDLEQLESKLSAYYAKVEKETTVNKRYVQYNDLPSPLGNAEKLNDSNRRDDEMRREKDESFKSYERDPRLAAASQRKENQRKVSDMFENDQILHSESKMPSIDTTGLNAKWKAVQAARRETIVQKWPEVQEKKLKAPMDSEDEEHDMQRTLDKSLHIRKQMQRDLAEKRASQQITGSASQLQRKDSPLKQQAPIKYPTPQPQNKFQNYGHKDSIPTQNNTNKFSSHLGNKFQPIGQSDSNRQSHSRDESPNHPSKNDRRGRSRSRSMSDHDRRHSPHGKAPPLPPGRPASPGRRLSREKIRKGSRSRSRSHSSSGSSRSRSVRRSRSRSYSPRRSGSYERKYSRSPSRTNSGSKSRSRSYSRSRSRSRSGERHRRRQFRNYNSNNRGTYYKPRFTPFNQNRGNQGSFQNRNRYGNQHNPGYQNRYNNNRRNYQNRSGQMNNYHNRGRMQNRQGNRYYNNRQGGYRDNYRDRRDFRDRRGSRDRNSDRSYSPDPMRKVDEAKEKINKMIEDGVEPERRSRSRERSADQEKRQVPQSGGDDREEDDYERWGVEEGDEKSNVVSREGGIGGFKDDFIQRMKQKSQNVLIKREIEAKTWYTHQPT